MWNTVKASLGTYLAHLAGYLVSGATIVSAINPKLLPPQYAFLTALAGVIVNAGHHGYTLAGSSTIVKAAVQAALDAASKAAMQPASGFVAKLLLVGMVGLVSGVSGCATLTGTQAAQVNAGVTVAVDIAAGLAIQQNSNDPAVWKARASEFKAIAVELQKVNNAGTATLATLAADLAPLVAKLPPADQLAANAAVAALVPFLQGQIQANPKVGAVQSEVGVVLSAFLAACAAYGA